MAQTYYSRIIIDAGRSTSKAFESYYEYVCSDPLKPNAGRIFGYLSKHPNATSQDIQNDFGLAKATVSECLSLLLERGYISYTKSEEDAREKKITLTEVGLARAKWYSEKVATFESRLIKNFSKEELDELKRLLEKVKKETEDMDYGK